MASTEIQVKLDAGQSSVTVRLFAPGTHGSPAETVSVSEDPDRDGLYVGTVTGSLSGWYEADKYVAAVFDSSEWIYLQDDSGPYIASDPRVLHDKADAIQAKTDLIGRITFMASSGAVDSNGNITVKAGDYTQITLTSDTADVVPDLTGQTIRFGISDSSGNQLVETTNATVLQATGLQSVQITLTPAQTSALNVRTAFFDLQAEYSTSDHRTLFSGPVTITPDYSGSP
jgi:hypothetical protein